MRDILWLVIAGSRGGVNRGRILRLLSERPYNGHQLSSELDLDYKTIRHHVAILRDHKLITSVGPIRYGSVWTLSKRLRESEAVFRDIWARYAREIGIPEGPTHAPRSARGSTVA